MLVHATMKSNSNLIKVLLLSSSVLPTISFKTPGSSKNIIFKNNIPTTIEAQRQHHHNAPLHMIKRNKQLDLLQKFNELNDDDDDDNNNDDDSKKNIEPTKEQKKADRDHKLFDRLLSSESANAMSEYSGDEYLTKEQEEDELQAMSSTSEDSIRLFEGDEVDSKIFEDLISIQTEKTVDLNRMLPWLKDSDSDDYVILFIDPRPKNNEFRSIITSCYASYPKPMMSKVYFINADTPSENRKFVRKQSKNTVPIPACNIVSDEKRLFMKGITALGDKRWSITMYVVAKGRIQSLVRDFDYEMLVTIVNNALKRYREYVS